MSQGFAPSPLSPASELASATRLGKSVLKHFDNLKDPRIERTKAHALGDILVIAILAIIAGAEGWEAIELYGQTKQAWLKGFLSLENGIPHHDTFARVFARLDPQAFHTCFQQWVQELTTHLGVQVIAIDGKTIRGSYDRQQRLKPLHVVSA